MQTRAIMILEAQSAKATTYNELLSLVESGATDTPLFRELGAVLAYYNDLLIRLNAGPNN
jgi:hypothetical protein